MEGIGNNYKNFNKNIGGTNNLEETCSGFKNHFAKCFVNCNDYVNLKNKSLDNFEKYFSPEKWGDDDVVIFSTLDVQLALHNLKCGKAAGSDGLTAEHLKYRGAKMIEVIVWLVNRCVKHGYVPDDFGRGVICPAKRKKHVCRDFDDFRPITLVNMLSKVVELLLHDKFLHAGNISNISLVLFQVVVVIRHCVW